MFCSLDTPTKADELKRRKLPLHCEKSEDNMKNGQFSFMGAGRVIRFARTEDVGEF